jgi:hypothetical protein
MRLGVWTNPSNGARWQLDLGPTAARRNWLIAKRWLSSVRSCDYLQASRLAARRKLGHSLERDRKGGPRSAAYREPPSREEPGAGCRGKAGEPPGRNRQNAGEASTVPHMSTADREAETVSADFFDFDTECVEISPARSTIIRYEGVVALVEASRDVVVEVEGRGRAVLPIRFPNAELWEASPWRWRELLTFDGW